MTILQMLLILFLDEMLKDSVINRYSINTVDMLDEFQTHGASNPFIPK